MSVVALCVLTTSLSAGADDTAGTERQAVVLASPGSLENLASDPARLNEEDAVSVPVSRMLMAMARLMRPRGATLDQTIAAIVRHNPEVFPNGNLKDVVITRPLKTPTVAQVKSEPPGSLVQLVNELNAAAGLPVDVVVAAMKPEAGADASAQAAPDSGKTAAGDTPPVQPERKTSRPA